MSSEFPVPLTRRQLRELEATGRFAPPASAQEPAEVGFFAALPMAVEASVTQLHVEELAGEEPGAAQPVSIEASTADDTVTTAPADDPFLLALFGAAESTVHPEAIPLVDGTVRGSRWVKRSRRDKPATRGSKTRAPKSRADKPRKAAKASAQSLEASAASAKPRGRRPASTLLSMGAMLFSAALLVGTTVPANAFITFAAEDSSSVVSASASTGEVQKVKVSTHASVAAATRDAFTVTSYTEVLKEKYGTRVHTFSPTAGTIRWPFPYATPISSGYGDRVAPCRGCSSHHNGVDFTPGMGTPIYAIADGVVRESTFGGSFGQHVYLDHVINGQKIESVYGHMIGGSSPLVAGQAVKVGDLIGLVGSTGASTGAHLHLEIRPDGVAVDPFAWLQANAN